MTSRLLAIFAVLMLLAGVVVGVIGLGDGNGRATRLLRRVSNNHPSAVPAVPAAREDPAQPPVYDVPRVDSIRIDGDGADWSDRGLRVNILANTSGKVEPKSDIDAQLRLGWSEQGLIALITVSDNIPLEDATPAAGDSVELFIASRPAGDDLIHAIIGPGVDPAQPNLRVRVLDQRTDRQLRKTPARISVARTKIPGGYVLEAMVPWSNFGIRPAIGQELAFQLQVNDLDAANQGSRLVWYPSAHTARDKTKMHRLRLAARPAQPVQVAAIGDYPRFHRTRITVVADVSLTNKEVAIVRPVTSTVPPTTTETATSVAPATVRSESANDDDDADDAAALPSPAPTQPSAAESQRALVTGKLEPDFIRPDLASAVLSLPMPDRHDGYGVLDVLIDGKRVGIVDLPDPGKAARWLLPYEQFVFSPCVFSSRVFPEGDFENPSYVEDLIGPYETKITFYDADFNVVTTADKPGRYGAVIEVRTEDGQTFKRFRTLFREPADFSWRNTEIPFTVKLPKEMGISAAAMSLQQHSVNDYFKQLLQDEGVAHDADTAVLLAGLYETQANPRPLQRNSPQAMDRAWWAELKRRTGEPVMPHLLYLPVAYDRDSAAKWPLVLFLHGKGERGECIEQVKEAGLASRMEYDRAFREQFPAIVVAPQCPADGWWSTHELGRLLDEIQVKYRVDPDRIYVTGMSMGGYGTWALASEFPDRFAAIAPVCGGGDPGDADRLARLPVWTFHGGKDNVVPIVESRAMIDAVRALGNPDVKLTTYPDAGHDAWTQTYDNPELYTWLLSHRRSVNPKAPLLAREAPTTQRTASVAR